MLPTGDELASQTGVVSLNVYECSRLTALIFAVAVTHPISNSYDLLQKYVTRLKSAIEESDLIASGTDGACLSGLFLWMLVLGGIAALEKPERCWLVSHLALLADRLDIGYMEVEKILESFLWLDSSCGPGGRELWAKVQSLST